MAAAGTLAVAPAAASPGLDASFSSAGSAGGPTATASLDNLLSYANGQKKLRIGKQMPFPIICALDCNARAVLFVRGPGTKLKVSVAGALVAGTAVPVILKPNGPLQKRFREFPGKFKVATKVSATAIATGETDSDTRTFGVKR